MNDVTGTKRQIYRSTLAMLILGGVAIALLLTKPLTHPLSVMACVGVLVPWSFALFTAAPIGHAAPDSNDARPIARLVFWYILLTPMPLIALLMSINAFGGEVGGGSTTVNGNTSYAPVYQVGTLGTALGWRLVCFNLVFMAVVATQVLSI
jgi:hypothetical protein